ncbi:OsmC family protein [Methylobacterium haplocladii]|uniref:Osmotically inducible protein OsmC n=1 Tax=Methylobacterium haplocladii TaxID=1176176 RepID=A0A512IR16_9HYPH|nr:OsmC family protein [Methylobacterium haplocladii]GEP00113.1 osmotically inducible protein OsmC [Methylobacterium haplocladii]GJD85365.1 Peroxiredoxin OsmC [Methylobacterium haplocladii]GLS58161.1 osmotically inducible protein OsmC [Methylobacterium haplocladii]
MTDRHASAHWEGDGKTGKGTITTQSSVLDNNPYGFNTRFENEPGTNPEELIAAAHASCFTMALAFQLQEAGLKATALDTKSVVTLVKDGDGFKVTKSALTLTAKIPGIDQAKFDELTGNAKTGCPISKVLNAEITLQATLDQG